MSKITAWLQAIRIKTLIIGLMPIILSGSAAYKNNQFNCSIFIVISITTIVLQSLTNVANDLYDYLQGADTENRKGFQRTASDKLLSKKELNLGILLLSTAAVLLGSYLVHKGGIIILITGLLSIFFAIAYTAKPFCLAYRGLGEVLVILFFGIIAVNLSYYLYSFNFDLKLFLLSLCLGFVQSAVLVVNNIRDEVTDKECGKNTLVVRFGRRFGQFEYACFLLLALLPFLYTIVTNFSILILILGIILISLSICLIKKVNSFSKEEELNKTLGQTAVFIILYTLFLCSIL